MSRAALLLILVAACAQPLLATEDEGPPNRWQAGGDSQGVRLRLRGRLEVDPTDGRIIFRVAPGACLDAVRQVVTCDAFPHGGLQGTFLRTPWGARALATSGGEGWIGFWVNWANTGVDALDDDAARLLAREWSFETQYAASAGDETWTPSDEDVDAMRVLIGKATQTEYELAPTEVPPRLRVVTFQSRGELRNGERGRLSLQVKNAGKGKAYRVRVRTRSNVPALHGLAFFFGALPPGASKTRQVELDVPVDNGESEAIVVLIFEEGNGHVPGMSDQRFAIRPAFAPPTLELVCGLRGLSGDQPTVDAGQPLDLDCQVKNVGAKVGGVQLTARVSGSEREQQSEAFALDADESRALSLSIEVPRNAQLDAPLAVVVEARDAKQTARPARVTLPLALARPKICPEGRLTREAYHQKVESLRKARADGVLSEDELRRYETELVGCLE